MSRPAAGPNPGAGGAGGRRWKLGIALGAGALGVVLLWRAVSGPPRFPAHVGPTPAVADSDLAAPRLAPSPKSPTIPGLSPGVPRPLPGLGAVAGASAPTLSADLTALVYVAEDGPRGGRDLMIADRNNATGPFRAPAPIEAVNTAGQEDGPSLSRDGRELIFLRDGRPFQATRASAGDPFRAPVPLELPEFTPGQGDEIDALQLLLDGLYVTYRLTRQPADAPESNQRVRIAFRAAPGLPFESAEDLPVWSPWASNRFSADVLRDYVATGEGLSVSTRAGLSGKFGLPGLLQRLTPGRIGPIEGPFWVAPKEDVLVYASPGPPPARLARNGTSRPDVGPRRRLWMVRIQ